MTNQSIGQAIGSLTGSKGSSTIPAHHQGHCSPLAASEAARQLLGFFRKGDAEDPDTYVAGIAALLARYPSDVAKSVAGPFGLAGKVKFLPTLSEVRDACEEAMRPRYEAASREAERRRIEEQLAERDRLAEVHAAVDADRVRSIADGFIDETAADLGKPRPSNDMTIEEAELKLATIKPIGPELGEDLRRLMDSKSDDASESAPGQHIGRGK